jgi:dienelactone hydrolase
MDGLFDDLLLIRKGDAGLTCGASPSMLAPVETSGEWAAKAAALRELFRQTLGIRPDVACPLDAEVLAERDHGTYVERRIAYNLEPRERVVSVVLLPKAPAGPLAGVLCIHPTHPLGKEVCVTGDGTPKGERRAYARHLAKRGYVTLAPDLDSAGERTYPGHRPYDNAQFYVRHPKWSGLGKDLWDLGRALDVLTSLPEVDPRRIAALGHSLGGSAAVYLAVVDERVRAVVCNCGLLPWRLSKNPYNYARSSGWVARPALRPYCLAGKPVPVDVHELFACIAPRSLLNMEAANDRLYDLDEADGVHAAWDNLEANVRRVYALFGAGDRFEQLIHDKGHDFDDPEQERAYEFLDRWRTSETGRAPLHAVG